MLTSIDRSRKDQISAQQTVSRGPEAAMAPLWAAVVCGLHDTDHWKLGQGRNSCVFFPPTSQSRLALLVLLAWLLLTTERSGNQALWPLISTRRFSQMRRESLPARGRSLQDLVLV